MSPLEIDLTRLQRFLDELDSLIGKLVFVNRENSKAMGVKEMKSHSIQCGETVICRDNQDVESLVTKNEFYLVKEVTHRGALLKVAGVPATLVSTRFTPVRLIPPAQEVTLGSD